MALTAIVLALLSSVSDRRAIPNALKTLRDEVNTQLFGGANARIDCAELTNPDAAGAATLLAAQASTVAVQTYTPTSTTPLIAAGLAKLLAFPRNLSFTTAGGTAADAPANVVVTGTGPDGLAQTETITLAQTATIANGVKAFATITSVVYAAGDGAGATVSIGIGNLFGLQSLPKVRGGHLAMVSEIVDGAGVVTGTFATPTASPPWGTYSPSTAADGAHDYAVYYERA